MRVFVRSRIKRKKRRRHTKATKQCACQTKKKEDVREEKKVNVDVYATEGKLTRVHQFFFFLNRLADVEKSEHKLLVFYAYIYI